MKESKEPEESHCPSNKDERDPKKEHATAPAAKSSETEENATGSASKSEDTHDKPNPMKTSLARIWTFVKAPERSNALVAIFTVVITLTGIIYTVFAGLQWSAMKNSIRIDQRAWAISSDFVLSGELNQNSYF
jgi:hypothetical protein